MTTTIPTRASSVLAIGLALAFLLLAGAASAESRIDLDLYDTLLSEYTRDSADIVGTRVDYRGLKADPRFARLVSQVEASTPSRLATREERLAFWINAYNILIFDTVTENLPLDSIRDVGSFFRPVWDLEAGRIEGKAVTLGGIEHETLRKMGEPRIHAAIVCASTSCPSLARTAFRPDLLDAQLDATTRRWLANSEKGAKLDRRARRVRISKIFRWFSEDFEPGGGVVRFVASHLDDPEDARWLAENADRVSVSYFDYDWTLNRVR